MYLHNMDQISIYIWVLYASNYYNNNDQQSLKYGKHTSINIGHLIISFVFMKLSCLYLRKRLCFF